MKTMKHLPPLVKLTALAGMAVALSCTSVLNAAVVFTEDFETDLGDPIYINSGSGYDVDRRSEANSPFPTSEGAALRVRDTTGTNAPSVEWELSSAVSAAAFSFDFNAFEAGGTNGSLRFGMGQKTGSTSVQLNTGDNMIAFAIILPSSFIYRQAGSAANVSNSSFTEGTNLTFDVFVNDFDSQSVNYTRPDNGTPEVLPANTVSYWFDGSLVGNVDFSDGIIDDGSGNITNLGSTEGNIGRFGFNGLGSAAGIVSHYDNLTVSAIPEPRTYALLFGSLVLGLVMLRRRLR